MSMPLLYTKYSWLYDIIYREYLERPVPIMVEFLREVFREDSERNVEDILDLACGTGGPTIQLAKHGYRVVGLDISREMIEIAAEKAKDKELDVNFIVDDMRNLRFNKEFDAVTLLFTSVNYNLRDEDMVDTFKGVYKSLRNGGVFILDAPNPYDRRWIEAIPYMWRVVEGDKTIVVLDSIKPNLVSGIVNWTRTIIVSEKGEIELVPDRYIIRLYSANELRLYAREAGFKKTFIYGDFIKRKDPEAASRIIMVAVK